MKVQFGNLSSVNLKTIGCHCEDLSVERPTGFSFLRDDEAISILRV